MASPELNKAVDFLFDLKSINCNAAGKYELKLELNTSDINLDVSDIKVEKGSELITDLKTIGEIQFEVTEENLESQIPVSIEELLFHFPEGFLQKDVETYIHCVVTKHQEASSDKAESSTEDEQPAPTVFMGKHIIYPRPETDEAPSSGGSINLYQILEEENIQKLGGKIWYDKKYTVIDDEKDEDDKKSVKEAEKEENEGEKEEDKPSDKRTEEVREPSSDQEETKTVGGNDQETKEEEHKPSSTPLSVKSVTPLQDAQQVKTPTVHAYLPNPQSGAFGRVAVILHAAHLTKSPQTSQARPFVKGFIRWFDTSSLVHESEPQETEPSQNATLSPLWEQQISFKIDPKDVKSADLVLQVMDHSTQTVLADFQLSLFYLEAFHQYHLDMMHSNSGKGDVHLFVSILYHSPELPPQDTLTYTALEVNVLSLNMQVANPVGPLTLVTGLCHDYYAFKQKNEVQEIIPTPVQFPSPHPSSFLVSSEAKTDVGYSQISLPSESETHPQWYQQFLFVNQGDLSSIFTDTAALVVSLSAASSAFDGQSWCLKQPVGIAAQLLDKKVYEALTSPRGKAGVKVHGVKLQSTHLQGQSSKPLGINLMLRLITEKNIESTISTPTPEFLPSLESFYHHEAASPEIVNRTESTLKGPYTVHYSPSKTPLPAPLIRKPHIPNRNRKVRPMVDETPTLPSYNAMENLLDRIVLKDKHGETLIPTRLPLESLSPAAASQQRPSEETSDRFAVSLLESQQRELDNYRQALQKMGEEMVALQQTVSKLEAEKSDLRRHLNMHEDAAKALVTAESTEMLTKAELMDKFITLKRALAQQVEESTSYRDKVLALQNRLIKFNDKERSFIEKEKERVNQQTLLQERNSKIKKLEETCRQQEMALEKMEKLLKKKLNKSPLTLGKAANQSSDNTLVDALTAENQSLKAHIAQLKVDSMAESTSDPAAEKLMKELQLEKAQKRIASLEKELINKAHEWGREKTAMRLSFGADRDDSRYRALPPLDYSYDIPSRRTDDYQDRGYLRQRPPPGHQHSRLSPLF